MLFTTLITIPWAVVMCVLPSPFCALRTPCAWRVAHMRELWADRGLGACRILSIHKRWEHPVYSTFLAEIVGLSVL